MPAVNVRIQHGDDDPAWPDLAGKDVVRMSGDTWHLAGLAKGMSSGKPSVALRLPLESGQTMVAETSLAAWIAATIALRGAFPDAFKDTPLEATW